MRPASRNGAAPSSLAPPSVDDVIHQDDPLSGLVLSFDEPFGAVRLGFLSRVAERITPRESRGDAER